MEASDYLRQEMPYVNYVRHIVVNPRFGEGSSGGMTIIMN
jgi:S-adenosylmethionine synthetase